MIIRTDLFPEPFLIFGFVFTPRELEEEEIRDARTYMRQWKELLWVGYPVLKVVHFLWVFLWTLEERMSIRFDPFALERQHVKQNEDGEDVAFGWRDFWF